MVLIANKTGLFKTTDFGSSYTKLFDGNCTSVDCYKNNSDIIYFSIRTPSYENNMYKTTDGGISFILINNGLNNTSQNTTIRISSVNSETVFTGYQPHGASISTLFMTTNGGIQWNSIYYDDYRTKIQDLYFSNLYENKIFMLAGPANCSYGAGVYVSDDYGYSWIKKDNGLPHCNFLSLAIEYNTPGIGEYLYIGAQYDDINKQNQGIFRSTDYGDNWQRVYSQPNFKLGIPDIASVNNRIYACLDERFTLFGLLKSENYGGSWQNVNNGMLCPSTIKVVAVDNNYIITGGYNTVYLSTDNGANFIEKTRGIQKANTTSVSAVNGLIFGTGYSEHPRIFKSTDYGNNWLSIYNDRGFSVGTAIDIDQNNSNFIHTSYFEADNAGTYIMRSTDQGLIWSIVVSSSSENYSELNKFNDIKVDPNNSSRVFSVGTLYGLSKVLLSANNGASYSQNYIKNDLENLHFEVKSIEIDPNIIENGYSKYVYVGGKYLQRVNLFRKSNGGEGEWNTIFGDLYNYNVSGDINQIIVSPVGASEFYYTYLAASTGVYRKTNTSDVWQPVNNGLNNLNVKNIVVNPLYTNILIISCDQNNLSTIYYSPDYGENWSLLESEFPILINKLKYGYMTSETNPILYAASDMGLYEIQVYYSDNNTLAFSTDYQIYNYPNPFNSSTTFKIKLNNVSKVEINLFDVTGQLVKTIYNGELNKGFQNISSNFDNLASGIYFYQLLINNSIYSSKKLVLLK